MALTLNDRKVIAKRWADGNSAVSIAKGPGCAPRHDLRRTDTGPHRGA